MNLARQIAILKEKGFSEERAEIIVLMREAAVFLFKAFPESFLLHDGANLIFFHNSTRHSADLDLLSISKEMPNTEELRATLAEGLKPLSELLNIAPLKEAILSSDSALKKIMVAQGNGKTLFTVDVTRIGAILGSGVEERPIESASS